MSSAYLLVSHGSRDPRPQVAMERLASLLSKSQTCVPIMTHAQERWGAGENHQLPITVGTAYLELSPVPLHMQIIEFADRAVKSGYNRLQIVPLFLLPGMHVMEDIPAEVDLAQKILGQKLQLEVRPYLGTHPGIVRLLATGIASTKAEARILLAHGSRRAGATQPVEAIAHRVGALSAYWAVAPSLESRVQELVGAGYRQIGIIPYFLFAGGITDAIAVAVEQLQEQFSSVRLDLAEPLGASQELADLIWDLINEPQRRRGRERRE